MEIHVHTSEKQKNVTGLILVNMIPTLPFLITRYMKVLNGSVGPRTNILIVYKSVKWFCGAQN